MANSVDPDQMPHSVASDLGLHYLQSSICLNTSGYYGTVMTMSNNSHTALLLIILSALIQQILFLFCQKIGFDIQTVLLRKIRKYFEMSIAEFFTYYTKHLNYGCKCFGTVCEHFI